MYKNIAVSGDIGTGKTTLCRLLSKELGWQYISGGSLIRKWYEENGIDFRQINAVPEEVDRKLEADFAEMMNTQTNKIFESRLSGWLARENSQILKVLVKTDFDVAMERVAKREGISLEEAKKRSQERAEGLVSKFKALYGVDDFLDEKYFDLVIDTTSNSAEKALEMVMEKMN